jgi:hypothetical protein
MDGKLPWVIGIRHDTFCIYEVEEFLQNTTRVGGVVEKYPTV